jgi:hypothetical protein
MFKNRSFLVKLVNDKDAPETEPVEETIDIGNIMTHLQKNMGFYILGIGVLVSAVRNRGLDIPAGEGQVNMRPISILSKQTISVTIVQGDVPR